MNRIAAFVSTACVSLLAFPALSAAPAAARTPGPAPSEVYCSGIYSTRAPRTVGSVVGGEDSTEKLLFAQGDSVYLRLSAGSSAKTGEQFLVIRPAADPIRTPWFRGQEKLEKRMGRLWEDVGRVRVVRLAGKTVVARVASSCAPMDRGDVIVALRRRVVPSLPAMQQKDVPANLPASSRAVGLVVSSKGFRQVLGAGSIAYVDLGTRQGAKTGDRLLLFRRPGTEGVEINRTADAGSMGDSGRSPTRTPRGRLPREILGQAVILRVSSTAATILITASRREIDLGDYAALE